MLRTADIYNRFAVLIAAALSIVVSFASIGHASPQQIDYQDAVDVLPSAIDQDPRAFTGKPISLVSGAETFNRVDLTIGNIYPINIRRNYISRSEYDSTMGYGWAMSYDKRLFTLPNGSLLLREGAGKRGRFELYNGQYVIIRYRPQSFCNPGHFCGWMPPVVDKTIVLVKNEDGTYTVTRKGGDREQYDSYGRLVKMQDPAGNAVVFFYELDVRSPLWGLLPANVNQSASAIVAYDYRVSRIEEQDAAGNNINRWVLFHYDMTTGRLTDLVDNTGRTVTYGHDSIGNLTSVAGPASSATYGYTDPNYRHSLTTVDEGDGVYTNTLNSIGWVSRQTHGTGSIDIVYPYLYGQAVASTTVKDSTGNILVPTAARTDIFNEYGFLIEETDANQNKTVFGRTGQGWLTREEHWEYTGGGLVFRDATNFTYDDLGNMLTKTEAQGTSIEKTTTYTYHPIYSLVTSETFSSVVDPFQNKTVTNVYDSTNGTLLTTTENGLFGDGTPYSYVTTYTYYSNGKIHTIDGPRSDVQDVTTFAYTSQGDIQSVTRPLIGTTTYSNHDGLGNPQTVTDTNGNITTYTYDVVSRVTSVKAPGDTATTQYSYISAGCSGCGGGGTSKISQIVLPEGNTITYTYDSLGNIALIADSLNNSINYTYDSKGNKLTEQIKDSGGSLQKSLSYSYDDLNRLSRVTNPDSSYIEYTYDFRNNKKSVKDPRSNTTNYTYDELGRLKSVSQPGSINTLYGYNTNNNLTSVADANTNTTTYKYDDKGRVYQVISPDTGTTTYTYDPAGNLLTKTDAKGVTISYTYDALNRLTVIDFPADTDIVYTYDACLNGKGRLCTMADASSTTSYEYTPKGQVKKETKLIDSVNYVTQYTYDQNGNTKTMTYPSGKVITYNYSNDRSIGVLNGAANMASNITYKPFGGMSAITYGNGLTSSIGYDTQYRLATLTTSTFQNSTYGYDNNGNITSIAPGKTYTYDPLDRLGTATGPWGSLGWTYDGVGNRQTENANTYTYTPNTNKLTSANGISFGYDNNGNTTTQSSRVYTYNQNQRLIQVTDGAMTAGYTYNGNGQRVKKNVNGTITIFHYNLNGQIIAESNNAGTITAEYVYLLNGQPLAKMEGANTYYYHNDHLGTPQKLTDSTGAVAWSADYKPFGEATITVSTITNNLRFPGQYFDAETGLNYNYYRDYNPAIGRYIETDPIGLQGGENHLFDYAKNNVLRFDDPLGLQSSGDGGIDSCEYYKDLCKKKTPECGKPGDPYACKVYQCCKDFGTGPKKDCVRKCLIDEDKSKCANLPTESQRQNCRLGAHFKCYTSCSFYPAPWTVPSSCWSIVLGS